MLYKLRIFLETEKADVYRDIEIQDTSTLEDLHNVIVQSFDFQGNEMASFYLTDNELNQGMEIPLFSMDETQPVNNTMGNTLLKDVMDESNPNLLYVYDYFSMWRFLVNLMQTGNEAPGIEYPIVVFAQGIRPENPPEINYDNIDNNEPDIFNGDDNSFDDYFGYDENEWN